MAGCLVVMLVVVAGLAVWLLFARGR